MASRGQHRQLMIKHIRARRLHHSENRTCMLDSLAETILCTQRSHPYRNCLPLLLQSLSLSWTVCSVMGHVVLLGKLGVPWGCFWGVLKVTLKLNPQTQGLMLLAVF